MPPKRAAARKAADAIADPAANAIKPVAAKPAPKKAAPKTKATVLKKTTTKPAATEAAAKPAPKKAAATKKPAAKTTTTTTKKPAATKAKAANTKKPAAKANTGVKRKATEEPEDAINGVNGAKRSRTTSTEPTKSTVARKKRTPVAKKPRVKGPILNHAATDPLNVYVFGEGSSGELGLGSARGQLEVKRPRLNPLLDADKVGVVSAAVGGMHTATLTKDNKILTWGVNDQGALGRSTAWDGGLRDVKDNESDSDSDDDSDTGVNPHESTPTEVNVSEVPKDIVWTQVACTDSATFALTDEGQVWGWGTFRVSPTFSFVDIC